MVKHCGRKGCQQLGGCTDQIDLGSGTFCSFLGGRLLVSVQQFHDRHKLIRTESVVSRLHNMRRCLTHTGSHCIHDCVVIHGDGLPEHRGLFAGQLFSKL